VREIALDGAAPASKGEGGPAEGGEMEGLTSSEISGFVVGALLLGATIAAPKVDGFIASSQRRSLPSSHFSVPQSLHFVSLILAPNQLSRFSILVWSSVGR